MTAHPRVGGENDRRRRGIRAGLRLIPAWAGKTSDRAMRALGVAAHPRVGGENRS